MASENLAVSSAAAGRAVRDIAREIRSMLQSPPEGIRLLLSGDDADCISVVHAEIDGPVGTPYEGGVFRMKLEFGSDFPHQPPKGYFMTRIFHPNIAKNGEICVNTLKRDWKPTLGLRHILIVTRCLLIEPYPESALNEEAGKLLLDDYAEYAHHARLMTSIHALPRHAHQQQTTAAAAAAGAEQSQVKGTNHKAQGKDSARSPGGGHEPGLPKGSPRGTGKSVSPSPLALNSSIVNSDENTSNGTGRSGNAVPGSAHALTQGHLIEQGEGGASMSKGSQGTREKAEKKKQDVRKKALKRL